MKIITQLIEYLSYKDILDTNDIGFLTEHGFITPREDRNEDIYDDEEYVNPRDFQDETANEMDWWDTGKKSNYSRKSLNKRLIRYCKKVKASRGYCREIGQQASGQFCQKCPKKRRGRVSLKRLRWNGNLL